MHKHTSARKGLQDTFASFLWLYCGRAWPSSARLLSPSAQRELRKSLLLQSLHWRGEVFCLFFLAIFS